MRVTLVSCCYEEGDFSYPLGALCIQNALKGKAALANRFVSDDPAKAARSIHSDLVGISVYLWNRAWFDTFVASLPKETKVFAGGPEVTANPGSFDLDRITFLSLGEGEESVPQAISQLEAGEVPHDIPGIVTKGQKISYACPEDLSKLDSVLLSGLADPFLRKSDSVLWELTRGCPFHCGFCFESKGVRSVRHFPMERIKKELDYLTKHHVHEIFVLDPTFNMDKERTKTLLKLFIKQAPGIHFTFENRAELLDEELVSLFAKLDCALQIGMQSTNPKALKLAGRAMNTEKFEHNVRLLAKYQVTFGLDVIIGLPGDDLKGFKKSIDDAISFKPTNVDIFLLSLLPGTVLGDTADELHLSHNPESPYLLVTSDKAEGSALAKAEGSALAEAEGPGLALDRPRHDAARMHAPRTVRRLRLLVRGQGRRGHLRAAGRVREGSAPAPGQEEVLAASRFGHGALAGHRLPDRDR